MAQETQIQLRRDLAANWTSADPTLAAGEPGYETDSGKIKYGDGSTAWTSLAYAGGGSSFSFLSEVTNEVVLAGPELTGSAATSALSIAQTWNTTGAPTLIKANVTNTASGAAAALMDLQVGGTSKFKVDKSGNATLSGSIEIPSAAKLNFGNPPVSIERSGTNLNVDYYGNAVSMGSVGLSLSSTRPLMWANYSVGAGNVGNHDIGFIRAGVGILKLAGNHDGTTGGAFELREMTAPAAPAADHGILFLQDNGAGKTQLAVIFSSGAAQILATQP